MVGVEGRRHGAALAARRQGVALRQGEHDHERRGDSESHLPAGIPKELFRVPVRASSFDVSGDGQKFIFAMPSAAGAEGPAEPVTVVLNWQIGLKK